MEQWIVVLLVIFVPMFLWNDHQASVQKRKQAKRLEEAYQWDKPNVSGDAHFSTDEECERGQLLTGKGLRLAYTQSGRLLTYAGDRHLLTVGPTGSGKARDSLVGALLSAGPVTIFCNDVKSQLLNICYRARLKVGPVLALAPFGLDKNLIRAGVRLVRYSPMAGLNDDRMLSIRSEKIAEGLTPEGDDKHQFWNSGSKALYSGVMMAQICHGRPEDKNLPSVCNIISGDIFAYCRDIMAVTTNPYIKARLGPYAAEGAEKSRTLLDLIQTAQVNGQFISNDIIGPSLFASDFSFAELREKPSSVFLVLPADAPTIISRQYYRLLLASAFAEMMSEECLGKTRVLMVLDEAGSVGRMTVLEQAVTIARGYGIQIWSVYTDVPQMQAIFGNRFRSFLANAGIKLFFPPDDTVTADEISKISGQTEILTQSRSVTTSTSRFITTATMARSLISFRTGSGFRSVPSEKS